MPYHIAGIDVPKKMLAVAALSQRAQLDGAGPDLQPFNVVGTLDLDVSHDRERFSTLAHPRGSVT